MHDAVLQVVGCAIAIIMITLGSAKNVVQIAGKLLLAIGATPIFTLTRPMYIHVIFEIGVRAKAQLVVDVHN